SWAGVARGRGFRRTREGALVKHLGIAFVFAWRWTIGLLTPARTCKYHPSCSQYAIDAFREFGLVRGGALATWRLLRCNPWSHGGVDYARDQTVFPLGRSRKAKA
ncbi:MAG: membrane protein insertion efficiency factor YidD, partial [Gaiellaceae bacterium]